MGTGVSKDQWDAYRRQWEAFNRWEESVVEEAPFAQVMARADDLYRWYQVLHPHVEGDEEPPWMDTVRHVTALHRALASLRSFA